MNNKGQSLVLFVVILPIIILILVLIIDMSRLSYEKNKLDNLNMFVLKEYNDKNDKQIENIIRENDNDIENIEISRDDNTLLISKNVKVIFVGILHKNKYEIDSKYKLDNEKIIKVK